MSKKPFFIITCAGMALFFSAFNSLALADGLDARTHSKVMRAKREQAMIQHEQAQNPTAFPPVGQQQQSPAFPMSNGADPCAAGVNIGNVMVDNNNRFGSPRENTVVVTGDVIFAPSRNCR